ncbi:MAG: FtsW/RodA/SpoVE family cell cycle protein [Alloprevotella sp.]
MRLFPENFKYKNIFQGSTVIWIIYFLLCVVSLVEVYSASSQLTYKSGEFMSPLIKQAGFLCVGFLLCSLIQNVPCRYFKLVGIFGIPISIILLVAALAIGRVNDGARWIPLLFGFRFQPSELAKGVVVTAVAFILASLQKPDGVDRRAVKYVMCVTLPICALIFTENLSTAAILFLTVFLMMFIARVPWLQLFKVIGGLMLVGVFLILLAFALPSGNFLEDKILHRMDTWKGRITQVQEDSVVIDSLTGKPFKIPQTKQAAGDVAMEGSDQRNYGYMAIASSNVLGRGPGNSITRDYLQQAYCDFIYAIILEEMGFFGGLGVAALYVFLLFQTGRIASRCERNFPAFLAMGLVLLMAIQACINMFVAVGLFPITGQTLPMISRGGTATIVNSMYFGMILSISRGARKNKLEEAGDMLRPGLQGPK